MRSPGMTTSEYSTTRSLMSIKVFRRKSTETPGPIPNILYARSRPVDAMKHLRADRDTERRGKCFTGRLDAVLSMELEIRNSQAGVSLDRASLTALLIGKTHTVFLPLMPVTRSADLAPRCPNEAADPVACLDKSLCPERVERVAYGTRAHPVLTYEQGLDRQLLSRGKPAIVNLSPQVSGYLLVLLRHPAHLPP